MGIPFDFLIAYVLGAFTFVPAVLTVLVLHAYLTFPAHEPSYDPSKSSVDLLQEIGDDVSNNLLAKKSAEGLAEKFQRNHEPDVAAGYFAVCREYVPGGINGKPPERTTPAGTVITAESPSVYQSMYRTIFDRKQPSTLDASKANGRVPKRARNVFFVVLRHGHLMLYEDSEQLEVKYVISLEHHDVSVYGGGDIIPEGELWIKRNAIKLTRKARVDEGVSKPFYFFSDNCSDKEDFYFALLLNQEVKAGAHDNPPRPLQYDPKNMIGLVQRLHSSEEQLQTRWLNGLIGRLFLALYRTSEVEDFIHRKVTKKIARVKKPAFLSSIVLRKIDMGDSAPQITNPRLKDLTINGDCCVEADLKYNGDFRLEIAATARFDLGTRFKAREVNLILAVVVKKLNGHGLLKIKPPPSNRIWMTFERMPDMDLSVEPIVSSRQITYGVIHRAIESRIREVIAETVVLPHWDDSHFTDTAHEKFRGGIWAALQAETTHTEQEKSSDESPDDEVGHPPASADATSSPGPKEERRLTTPTTSDNAIDTATTLESSLAFPQIPSSSSNGSSPPTTPKIERPPKALRSTSFASAADPLLSHASVDSVQGKKTRSKTQEMDATASMMAISSRSPPSSPFEATVELFPATTLEPHQTEASNTRSSNGLVSRDSKLPPTSSVTIPDSFRKASAPTTPTTLGSQSIQLVTESEDNRSAAVPLRPGSTTSVNKKQSIVAIGAATAAAKKWGWGVLARTSDTKNQSPSLDPNRAGTPKHPIGRGRPLPPLGQPLPFPDGQRSKTSHAQAPKRKPLPPQPQRQWDGMKARSSPEPPLPARRGQSPVSVNASNRDSVYVVKAPESEPPSPSDISDLHGCEGNAAADGLSTGHQGSEEDLHVPSATTHPTVE
ncbi:MAG: hypothetical protein Q9163_004843 [Psora crenata]